MQRRMDRIVNGKSEHWAVFHLGERRECLTALRLTPMNNAFLKKNVECFYGVRGPKDAQEDNAIFKSVIKCIRELESD